MMYFVFLKSADKLHKTLYQTVLFLKIQFPMHLHSRANTRSRKCLHDELLPSTIETSNLFADAMMLNVHAGALFTFLNGSFLFVLTGCWSYKFFSQKYNCCFATVIPAEYYVKLNAPLRKKCEDVCT